MNRLLAGSVTVAGSLALVGGVMVTTAAASAGPARAMTAHHTVTGRHAVKAHHSTGGDNSSYGSSAPAGPITAPPQGLAQSTGPTSVLVRNVNISGLLSTSTTLDTASTLTAFSRVTSVNASVSGSGHSVKLTADQVSSTCRSDTLAASTSIVNGVLTVDGTTITDLPEHPTVGQAFPLDGGADGTVTLNNQIPATGGGVEVQGVHIHFTGTTPAQDLFIAVSVCTSPGTAGNTVTVTNPGPQTSNSGTPITPLQIAATDTDTSQTLTCSATGLPPGLTIDPVTCTISGTPTTATGSPFSVTVTATDSTGASGSTTFTWTINNVVTVTNPGPQTGTVGTAFTLAMSASDSDTSITTFTWAATGLPPGLTINTATGVISGTPTTATGSPFAVHVTATDSTGASGSADFNITITSPNTITVTAPANQTSSIAAGPITPLTVTVTDTGVVPPGTITCTATGLPAGLTIAASGGNCVISGTPTTIGTTSVAVTATDSTGAHGTSSTFTWTITA